MAPLTCLLIVVISISCISALPTRADGEEGSQKDDRLLFEPNNQTDTAQGQAESAQGQAGDKSAQTELSERDKEIMKLAKEQAVGRDGPDTVNGIGSKTGDDVAHDTDGDAHESKEVEETPEEKVDPGPNDPGKEFHGVLMHGDVQQGKEHEHEETAEEKLEGDATVVVGQVAQAGEGHEDSQIPDGIPDTVDTERVMHGDDVIDGHDAEAEKPDEKIKNRKVMGGYAVQDFMHDLMHGESGDHDHADAELKKGSAFRPRDLLKLGLDEKLLQGVDLKKLIKEDIDEYNRYIAENGGDEDSVWNIFNSFEFRYFKDGTDIDDISSRAPTEEEWDDSVVSHLSRQHEGEDSIDHLMEDVAKTGEVTNVHGSKSRPTSKEV